MFQVSEFNLDSNIKLAVIDIPDITDELRAYIDSNIVLICEGDSGGDVSTVKKDLAQLFRGSDGKQRTSEWIMGAIAEFFMHLFIRHKSYKQEFLYRNLEENSIKKGFDGLYSKESIIWLMESKSGSINSVNISHKSKIKEAMKDLSDKVSGNNQTNNPWKNAYSHVSMINVNSSTTLRSDIKRLSDDFINGNYQDISFFNTIPCGTIFLDGEWRQFNIEAIKSDIDSIKANLKGKNIYVLCMTHKTVDMFIDYINN